MHIKIDVNVHLANVDQLESIQEMLDHLLSMGEDTMTVISDAAGKVKEGFARMDVSFAGVTGDIAAMVAKIEELQSSPGAITPEDQALLDEIQAMADAFAVKFEDLDAQNPPVEPSVA